MKESLIEFVLTTVLGIVVLTKELLSEELIATIVGIVVKIIKVVFSVRASANPN